MVLCQVSERDPCALSLPHVALFRKAPIGHGFERYSLASIQVSAAPRGTLDQILGGYRRIPVLQRGAHFYCDTRLALKRCMTTIPRSLSLVRMTRPA